MQKENITYQRKKFVKLVRENNHTIIVNILNDFFLLRGVVVEILVWDLLEFLSEPASLVDIYAKFNKKLSEQDIDNTLTDLLNRGVIEKYAPPSKPLTEDAEKYFSRHLLFLNFFSNVFLGKDNYSYFNSLRNSTVAIIDLGNLGREILNSLIVMGVAKIISIDSDKVDQDSHDYDEMFYTLGDIGLFRRDVIKNKIAGKAKFSKLEFYDKSILDASFDSKLKKVDLFIVASDFENNNYNSLINKKLFDEQKTTLFVEADYLGGRIGPCVIPGHNACFHCYIERKRSNINYLEHYDFYSKNFDNSKYKTDTRYISDIYSLLAQYTSLEVLKILTSFMYPKTYKGYYSIDYINIDIEYDEVLKHPFCDVCGYIGKRPPSIKSDKTLYLESE